MPTPAWTVESNVSFAQLGMSTASAGDVNGDGYDDVLVGAPRYANGQGREGAAALFLGGPGALAPTPAWTVEGNTPLLELGTSVASAGDVNSDGFDDVLVGAPAGINGGKVHLYLGSVAGLSPTAAWTGAPGVLAAEYGYSVAGVGDVDGDGYDDVVVGSPSLGPANQGGTYLYLGGPGGLAAAPAWTQLGAGGGRFGHSVAGVGDVNGDGFADVAVGEPWWSLGFSGRVVVYYGYAGGLRASGWAITGPASAELGTSVAGAGDIDGDGYDDLLVGAPGYGMVGQGGAALFHGGPLGPDLAPSWAAVAPPGVAQAGTSVAAAGDVNGDGFPDVVVGAPGTSLGGAGGGAVAYYLGGPAGLPVAASWATLGAASSRLGVSVAAAGDVDGDGLGDVIAGAPAHDGGQPHEGSAIVYLGW